MTSEHFKKEKREEEPSFEEKKNNNSSDSKSSFANKQTKNKKGGKVWQKHIVENDELSFVFLFSFFFILLFFSITPIMPQ